jgi:outer membrane receptor for ferrienterochelin and colicin
MHRKTGLVAIVLLLIANVLIAQQKRVLSGYITEKGSKELLIGATISAPKYKTGTITNAFGFYSLSLPADSCEIIVTYIGFAPKAFKVDLSQSDNELNVEMIENKQLKEVTIKANKNEERLSQTTRMSVIEIPIQQIKEIPALLGEKDVLKVIQLLPGVQKPSEGNSGIYVRGGGPDQNLIILDDANVYNAFHLFGFFSLFNGDALKSIELTKGGFTARYGGRLSSVIDLRMKEGNKEKIKGEAGIGVLSSRLVLEGPIVKGKSSFIVSGRRTYFDLFLLPFQPADNKSGYYFYDFNAKANYEFSNKNKLYVSGYWGRDQAYGYNNYSSTEKNEYGIGWGNATATVRWNHLFSNKLFANASAVFTDYDFTVIQKSNNFSLNFSSGIRDYMLKYDIDYRPNNNHNIKAGLQSIYHLFTPSALVIDDKIANSNTNKVNQIGAFENALYVEDDIKLGSKLRLNPGLRITHFATQQRNYINLEPRFNASYNINSTLAAKASFSYMNQYIHMLSNTGVGLPTDLWVPSSNNIKPQQSWQVAAGFAKDFIEKDFSVSLEGYYKKMDNIIAYKEGASFLGTSNNTDGFSTANNYNWEQNITAGQGWSYGTELLVQKKVGKLTGWIGYTLSFTQWQFDELNFGKAFWARHDRRHDISVVAIYKIRKMTNDKNGVTLSGTWVYGTGNAITLPIAEFNAPVHNPGSIGTGSSFTQVSQYTGRNQFRMAAYHRMDVGIQLTRKMKHWIRTWEMSIYNIYNRYNPYFYFISSDIAGNRSLKQVTLFPLIPSISWNIKF